MKFCTLWTSIKLPAQAGLASYFLQPGYTAQLAQLQQAAMLPWGAQTPFEMLSSVFSFQAYASQQQAAAQALATTAAATARGGEAAAPLSCPAGAPLSVLSLTCALALVSWFLFWAFENEHKLCATPRRSQ